MSHAGFRQLLHLTYNNPCPPFHTLVLSQVHSPSHFTSISFCGFPSSSSFSLPFHLLLLSFPSVFLFSFTPSFFLCFPTTTSDLSPLGDKAHPLFVSLPHLSFVVSPDFNLYCSFLSPLFISPCHTPDICCLSQQPSCSFTSVHPLIS